MPAWRPFVTLWLLWWALLLPASAGGSCDTITGTCYCLPQFVSHVPALKKRIKKGLDMIPKKFVLFGLPIIDPMPLIEPVDRLTTLLTYILRLGELFADFRIVLAINAWNDQPIFVNEGLDLLCSNVRVMCFRGTMRPEQSVKVDKTGIGALLGNEILNHIRDMLLVDEQLAKMDIVLLDPDLWIPTNENAPVVGIAEALAVTLSEPEYRTYDVICGNHIRGEQDDLVADAQFDTFEAGVSLRPVRSCFGGFAMYNLNALLDTGCRFHVRLSSGHSQRNVHFTTLNACLASNGHDRLYINPAAFVHKGASEWKCKRFPKKQKEKSKPQTQ